MQEIRKVVVILQMKIKDLMDKPASEAAKHLKTEVQGLEDDLQVGKNPRTVEDRVKRIIHILEGEAKADRIMNYEHLVLLRKQFEHIEESLRKLY